MATELSDVVIDEISLVDKGANPGAKAVLVKREFSTEERDAAASSGAAMPDGSYPIKSEQDLKNAIQAFGRAKDKPATKAHIIRRAKALGLSELIPANWSVKKNDDAKSILRRIGEMLGMTAYGEKSGEDEDEGEEEGEAVDPADADMQGLSFNAAYNAIEAREYAADILEEVQEACEALYRSIHSILDDETVSDPEAAVKATVDQFKAHMTNLVPEEMEKALVSVTKALAAGSASKPETVNKGDTELTEDVTKALADKDAEIARLTEIVKGSYSADEVDYMGKMDEAGKAKFRGMSAADRKAEMEKACKMTKREDLPEDIRKKLDEAEAIEKRLAALEAERDFESFKKRADSCGLAADAAKHLQVIAKASPEALDFVEKLAKAAQEIEKRSPLFKEMGSDNGQDVTSAEAQLTAKAHEIAKSDNVSFAKAYVKACEQNNDLYRAYRAERG